jgi:hypothetical protein
MRRHDAGRILLVFLIFGISLQVQNRAPARRVSLSLGAIYAGSRLGYSYNYVDQVWLMYLGEPWTLCRTMWPKGLSRASR